MVKKLICIAAISGFISVALGAFGSHALKERLSPELLQAFETGVRYQFYHTLTLFVSIILFEKHQIKLFFTSAYLFIAGIILFSGSLYILALSGTKIWGAVTPFGGICFLSGWLCLLSGSLKIKL